MLEKIKTWFASHDITTHTVAVLFAIAMAAYTEVPQFHDLVLSVYNAIPLHGQNLIATALALYAWYRRGQNPQS